MLVWALLSGTVVVVWAQLDCDFDEGSLCSWRNAVDGEEDDFDWATDSSVPVDFFHSIPRTLTGSGFFAYAQGPTRGRAMLRSPTVAPLDAGGTLSFVYWKTALPPTLSVCVAQAGDSELLCLDTVQGLGQQQWTQRIVPIPPSPFNSQIYFVAENFGTALDLLGIDDVVFTTTARPDPSMGKMGLERVLVAQLLASMLLSSKSCSNFRRRVNADIVRRPLPQQSASRDAGGEQVEVVPDVVFDQEYAVKESVEVGPVEEVVGQGATLGQPTASAPADLLCPPLSCSFAQGYCRWHNAFEEAAGGLSFRIENGRAMEGQEEAQELQRELWERLGWQRRRSFAYAIGSEADDGAQPASAETTALQLRSGVVNLSQLRSGAVLGFSAAGLGNGTLALLLREDGADERVVWQQPLRSARWRTFLVPLSSEAVEAEVGLRASGLDGRSLVALGPLQILGPRQRPIPCPHLVSASSTSSTASPASAFPPSPAFDPPEDSLGGAEEDSGPILSLSGRQRAGRKLSSIKLAAERLNFPELASASAELDMDDFLEDLLTDISGLLDTLRRKKLSRLAASSDSLQSGGLFF